MGIAVENLTVEYTTGGYVTRPLDKLSFKAGDGELVVVLGASGCGKTTLLSVLGGILSPTSGSVNVHGRDVATLSRSDLVSHRRDTVGFIFQSFNLVASLTAQENVEAPLRAAGVRRQDARRRARALLERVGLSDRAHYRPHALSGGQQQRVAIARSLAHDAPVLLADEPTAHLDFIQVEGIVRLLRELASGSRTVVVATHDHRLLPVADRVIELTPQQAAVSDAPKAPMELDPAELLFTQGEPSDFIYVVNAGSIDVFRECANGASERLASVAQGQYVGELGPLLGLPRSATARAGRRGAVVSRLAPAEFRAGATLGWDAAPRPLRVARQRAQGFGAATMGTQASKSASRVT